MTKTESLHKLIQELNNTSYAKIYFDYKSEVAISKKHLGAFSLKDLLYLQYHIKQKGFYCFVVDEKNDFVLIENIIEDRYFKDIENKYPKEAKMDDFFPAFKEKWMKKLPEFIQVISFGSNTVFIKNTFPDDSFIKEMLEDLPEGWNINTMNGIEYYRKASGVPNVSFVAKKTMPKNEESNPAEFAIKQPTLYDVCIQLDKEYPNARFSRAESDKAIVLPNEHIPLNVPYRDLKPLNERIKKAGFNFLVSGLGNYNTSTLEQYIKNNEVNILWDITGFRAKQVYKENNKIIVEGNPCYWTDNIPELAKNIGITSEVVLIQPKKEKEMSKIVKLESLCYKLNGEAANDLQDRMFGYNPNTNSILIYEYLAKKNYLDLKQQFNYLKHQVEKEGFNLKIRCQTKDKSYEEYLDDLIPHTKTELPKQSFWQWLENKLPELPIPDKYATTFLVTSWTIFSGLGLYVLNDHNLIPKRLQPITIHEGVLEKVESNKYTFKDKSEFILKNVSGIIPKGAKVKLNQGITGNYYFEKE